MKLQECVGNCTHRCLFLHFDIRLLDTFLCAQEPGGAVDAFLALLELLLQRQLESSTAETERANDDTMNKDFAILMHSVPSGSETLRRFFRVLLECDVFTKYFMCSVGTASKGKSTKAERHLSEMISMTVVNIVLLVPQESDISESVQIYKDKTIDCLKYAGKSSVLLSSISALSKYFNNHEVSTCLQYLLNLPREALMDGDRLTANGNLIVTLFRRLLEVEESVFVTICSVDIVRNVVKLFAESNNIGIYSSLCDPLNSVFLMGKLGCESRVRCSIRAAVPGPGGQKQVVELGGVGAIVGELPGQTNRRVDQGKI